MPRISSSRNRRKKQQDGFFPLLIAVVMIAFLAGLEFYFDPAGVMEGMKYSSVANTEKSIAEMERKGPAILMPVGDFGEGSTVSSFDPEDHDPQCIFYSSQRNVLYGQTVRLMWDCINSTSCRMEGIGEVPFSNAEGLEISPERSGRYELTCNKGIVEKDFGTDIWVFEFTIRELPPPTAPESASGDDE
jgi:hypothetical protein